MNANTVGANPECYDDCKQSGAFPTFVNGSLRTVRLNWASILIYS